MPDLKMQCITIMEDGKKIHEETETEVVEKQKKMEETKKEKKEEKDGEDTRERKKKEDPKGKNKKIQKKKQQKSKKRNMEKKKLEKMKNIKKGNDEKDGEREGGNGRSVAEMLLDDVLIALKEEREGVVCSYGLTQGEQGMALTVGVEGKENICVVEHDQDPQTTVAGRLRGRFENGRPVFRSMGIRMGLEAIKWTVDNGPKLTTAQHINFQDSGAVEESRNRLKVISQGSDLAGTPKGVGPHSRCRRRRVKGKEQEVRPKIRGQMGIQGTRILMGHEIKLVDPMQRQKVLEEAPMSTTGVVARDSAISCRRS